MKISSALPANNSNEISNGDNDNKHNNNEMKRKYQISTECTCQIATDPTPFSKWEKQHSTYFKRIKFNGYDKNGNHSNISNISDDNFVSKVLNGDNDREIIINSNLKDDGLIKYENFLEKMDPEDLCDCENCLSVFEKSPERVLACYGIDVDDKETATENDFENNQYSDEVDNFDDDFFETGNGDDKISSTFNNFEDINKVEKKHFLVNKSNIAFAANNSISTYNFSDDTIKNYHDFEADIKHNVIKNFFSGSQPKPYEPLVIEKPQTFSPSMPFIAQRKQEKPLDGLKIVTISLNCKVETCPLIFLDKNQLDFHMLYAHDMHPFKCWAGCVDAYFPCRKTVGAHNKEKHPDNNLWICDTCPNKSYAKYNTLYSHIRLEHETGTFTCTWPDHNVTFRTRHEVLTHIHFEHSPVDDNGLKIKKKKYVSSKSATSATKTLQNDTSFIKAENHDDSPEDNGVKNDISGSKTRQLRLSKPKKEPKRPLTPEIEEKVFSLDNLPLPVRERKLLSNKQKESLTSSNEKFICRWPACGQTSRLIRNLQTHIRTVHFKLLKTNLPNDKFNATEIEEKVSQYIYNTL